MKSLRAEFTRYGGPATMQLSEYEVPALRPGDVRVRVQAAALNPLDWKQRQGSMKLFMSRRFPKGLGNDFAGLVEAVGADVRHVQVGDAVLGTMPPTTPGAIAQVLVTPGRLVTKKPATVPFAEAACLPIAGATTWAALLDKGQLRPGARVLINGCTGAVGALAVQLALAHGARVAGTCSAARAPWARQAGVGEVFDYADPAALAGAGRFDVVFDTPGTLPVGRGLALLTPRGRFIDINPTPGRVLRGLFSRRYKLVFATMGLKQLPQLAALAGKGQLRPVVGQQVPLAAALDTLAAVENGRGGPGRTVIVP